MKSDTAKEIFNLDSDVFQSIAGERVRMSIQLSPSNDPIKFKVIITPSQRGQQVIRTSCGSSCPARKAPIWIRARLGRLPPNLVTKVISDEAFKTFYIDSDGRDEEFNATAAASSGPATSTGGNGDPIFPPSSLPSSSSTGAFRRLLGLFEQEEDGSLTPVSSEGDQEEASPNEDGHYPPTRRLLSATSALEDAFPVLRWDKIPENGTLEFSLLADTGFKVSRNDYLYLDIYHGVMMTGFTDDSRYTSAFATTPYRYAGQDPALTTTNVGVEITISDSLGTLVGNIAAAILAGFTFFLIVYLIVIRCKYGSISRGIEVTVLGHAVVQKGGKKIVDEKKLAKVAPHEAYTHRRHIRPPRASQSPSHASFCVVWLFLSDFVRRRSASSPS